MERRLVGVAARSTGWFGTTWSNHPCEALPRGDPKDPPPGRCQRKARHEGRKGAKRHGSDLPVPKAPEGRQGFIPTKLSRQPHLRGVWWCLPTQRQGSGRDGSHLPPKKYEVPVRISSGYETLTSAPSTSSMLMTAWFSWAAKFTSCQKPSFRRYPEQEERMEWVCGKHHILREGCLEPGGSDLIRSYVPSITLYITLVCMCVCVYDIQYTKHITY